MLKSLGLHLDDDYMWHDNAYTIAICDNGDSWSAHGSIAEINKIVANVCYTLNSNRLIN